ncbi:DUF480 domain-containing protein [Thermomonas sp.]|uniref:DUF480 domain-containing protein n=1 Tax=Thermomonas sp. TaxID=1971895 RepID=UPI00391DD859
MDDIAALPLLGAAEARALGCLIEKEATTPHAYPLTINAVQAAVNQKTAREPVMALEPGAVNHARDRMEPLRSGCASPAASACWSRCCGGTWLRTLFGNGTMLVLTLSTAYLLLGLHWRQRLEPRVGLRCLGWLRAQGRRSYEIYLTHMFVVYSLVALLKASGADIRGGWLWHLPAVLLCWGQGELMARGFSDPVERALRRRPLGDGKTGSTEVER